MHHRQALAGHHGLHSTLQCTENRVGVVFGDSGVETQPQLIHIPVNTHIWPVILAAHWSVRKVGVFHQSYLEKNCSHIFVDIYSLSCVYDCRTHRVPTLLLLFPSPSPSPSVTKQTHQYHQYFHDLSVAINILYIAGKLRTLSIIS